LYRVEAIAGEVFNGDYFRAIDLPQQENAGTIRRD